MIDSPPSPPRNGTARLARSVFNLLSSYGLATVLLFFLLLLTVLGTWEQKDIGLYETQRRYFTSLFVVHHFGPLPLPLPGVYLLLVLFSLNLALGAAARIRRRWASAGVYVIHGGMLILLLAALITHYCAIEGQMTLAPGERSSRFYSGNEWELAVTEFGGAAQGGGETQAAPAASEQVITLGDLARLADGRQHPIALTGLPFSLSAEEFFRNASVMPESQSHAAAMRAVNGFVIRPLPLEKENSQNMPAALLKLSLPPEQAARTLILWSEAATPHRFEAGGKTWTLELRRRSWTAPFEIELQAFRRELHPGMEMAKSFESDVLKIEHGRSTPVTIRMNEPLRQNGYTFFQASFSENPHARGGYNSTFAVVRNPAGQWPLAACVVMTLGLLLHFGMSLFRHLRRGAAEAARTGAKTALLLAALAAFSHTAARAQEGQADEEASATAPAATASAMKRLPYPAEVLDAFSRWPIQDQGRLKPLSTFARFKLVKLCGRASFKIPGRRRMEPMEWLLETMLFPEKASDYKAVRVENPAVMQALGLPDKIKRTYFSFNDLLARDAALTQAARQAAQTPENERGLTERQILNLYDQYMDLGGLLHAFDFARYRVDETDTARIMGWLNAEKRGTVNFSRMAAASPMLLHKFSDPASTETTQTVLAAQRILNDLDHTASLSTSLAIFPPLSYLPPATVDISSQEWLSAGSLLQKIVTGNGMIPRPELAFVYETQRVVDAAGSPPMLAVLADRLGAELRRAAGSSLRPWKLDLEVFFYQAKFFQYALALFILSFLCVALSWLAPRGSRADRLFAATLPLLVTLPTLLLIAGIVIRCVIRGRPPVTTLYETTLFVPAVAIVAALITEWINRKRIALAVASALGVAGLFLANTFELKDGNDTMTSLVAVLNSNFWLATHVTTVSIGYSAGLLAAGIAHIYVLGRLFGFKRREPAFYQNVTRLTDGVVCVGTLFSFLGTVLGGVWANDSWGRFWGWDPKENGALAIILWNLIILHARQGGYIRALGLNMLALAGGMIVPASWRAVPLLGDGLHSYGFTSGILFWLLTCWGVELLVLAAGGLIPFLERRPDGTQKKSETPPAEH